MGSRRFDILRLGVLIVAGALVLGGCATVTVWRAASLVGKPIETAERRYGPANEKVGVGLQARYSWVHATPDAHSCRLTIDTSATGAIQNVKLSGDSRSCMSWGPQGS